MAGIRHPILSIAGRASLMPGNSKAVEREIDVLMVGANISGIEKSEGEFRASSAPTKGASQ